ncbi:MAG: hypothetical protein WCE79_17825 [Xanthobacteraceae bacterium]
MSNKATARERGMILQAWDCAFSGTRIVYLSGPITTGPRFVEWYRRAGRTLKKSKERYARAQRKHVTRPNEDDLRRVAARLRAELAQPVLEPSSLCVKEWDQPDYVALWNAMIERFAARLVMMPGWEYSAGSAAELHHAISRDIPVQTLDGSVMTLDGAIASLRRAAEEIAREGIPIAGVGAALSGLEGLRARRARRITVKPAHLRKDESLDRLADIINVAQFVSFSPRARGLKQEFCRIRNVTPNRKFPSVRAALKTLLQSSPEASINLRSYTPESPQSREFIYGIRSLDDALAAATRLGREGLHVIANETVDVFDGGVSGVLMGDVIEFAPDDTPRCVEKPGVASLPRTLGIELLSTVYGFTPDINVPRLSRLEFSIHPKPRGWRHTHTLGWEFAALPAVDLRARFSWPNRFSNLVGDKVYGLLIAHHIGLPVPRTTVINRRLAPFGFGRPTNSDVVWLRTSPREQVPGKFKTEMGWSDPFRLLQEEDESGEKIPSVLSQHAVPARFSGAAIVTAHGKLLTEGKAGEGASFMQGKSQAERLPKFVRDGVTDIYRRARDVLGPVRFEWVHDGDNTWVVQLHRGSTRSTRKIIVPGKPARWITFETKAGLEKLRECLATLNGSTGLVLKGEVGLTSHVADVIRRAGIPARIG